MFIYLLFSKDNSVTYYYIKFNEIFLQFNVLLSRRSNGRRLDD
uniref:Uncharacterized protein n=1 Tax=Podoviridae sp. ct3k57 TaxID=2825217 RepID=A0A8S5Q1F5_9CAUD|nr:MAG TPA: hypothetical protein [Podoviridae sp. ct3k57]